MPRRKLPESNIELKVGDICYLNSGSPPLTVHVLMPSADHTHIIAGVVWFSECGHIGSFSVPVVCLVPDKIDAVGDVYKRQAYAWFVWDKHAQHVQHTFDTRTEIKWIPPGYKIKYGC